MLDRIPPLISVPPNELSQHVLSGSVVPLTEILSTQISHELRVALLLLHTAFGEGAELRVVVRPEMFTHGSTLSWLHDQIEGIDAHLCLSDGEAIRVVPGLKNHVFFYGIGKAGALEGFLRLRRRAPELLAGLATQFNSALDMLPGQTRRPRMTLLPTTAHSEEGMTLPFFTSRGPVERDARALAGQDPVVLPPSQSLTYVAVSGAAMQNIPFMAGLIHQVIQTYTAPNRSLVIGLSPAVDVEEALIPVFTALRQHAFTLPSGMPPNVFVQIGRAAALPAEVFAGQSRLVAYEAEAFWQRPPTFYTPFGVATLLRERNTPYHRAGMRAVLQHLTERSWDEVILPDPERTSLARYSW